MGKSLRQGILVGIIAPLAFLSGIVYWVYRCTNKVPFPVSRPSEGELVIKLVEPAEVPAYWEQWREELMPMWSRFCALCDALTGRPTKRA